ncbi:MAG: hypothetical protein COA79_24180 [Planctomycetota bacterium]|nr:MAG: hypothetical protein COA79_24180 [Planctomycetota bacterium]
MIKSIEVITVKSIFDSKNQLLRHPAAHFAKFPRLGQESVIVKIMDEKGNVGLGEAWGLPCAKSCAVFIEDYLAPLCQNTNYDDYLGTWQTQWQDIHNHLMTLGHVEGNGMDALSGIDIALADLHARQKKQSVAEMLGSKLKTIKTYVSPVMLHEEIIDSVKNAVQFINEGHKGLKLKVGRGIEKDYDHVSAIRKAIGNDISLFLDANNAYNLQDSIALANHMEKLNITWLEDPLKPEIQFEMSKLREQISIPIASGEALHAPASFNQMLESKSVDYLVVNISRVGGFTGLKHIHDLCQKYNVALSLHGVGTALTQVASIHALSVLEPKALMEWNVFYNPMRHELFHQNPSINKSFVFAPEGIGLGMTLNESSLKQFQECEYLAC